MLAERFPEAKEGRATKDLHDPSAVEFEQRRAAAAAVVVVAVAAGRVFLTKAAKARVAKSLARVLRKLVAAAAISATKMA